MYLAFPNFHFFNSIAICPENETHGVKCFLFDTSGNPCFHSDKQHLYVPLINNHKYVVYNSLKTRNGQITYFASNVEMQKCLITELGTPQIFPYSLAPAISNYWIPHRTPEIMLPSKIDVGNQSSVLKLRGGEKLPKIFKVENFEVQKLLSVIRSLNILSQDANHQKCTLASRNVRSSLCIFCCTRSMILRIRSSKGRQSIKPIEVESYLTQLSTNSLADSLEAWTQDLAFCCPTYEEKFKFLEIENPDFAFESVNSWIKENDTEKLQAVFISFKKDAKLNILKSSIGANNSLWKCKTVLQENCIYFFQDDKMYSIMNNKVEQCNNVFIDKCQFVLIEKYVQNTIVNNDNLIYDGSDIKKLTDITKSRTIDRHKKGTYCLDYLLINEIISISATHGNDEELNEPPEHLNANKLGDNDHDKKRNAMRQRTIDHHEKGTYCMFRPFTH